MIFFCYLRETDRHSLDRLTWSSSCVCIKKWEFRHILSWVEFWGREKHTHFNSQFEFNNTKLLLSRVFCWIHFWIWTEKNDDDNNCKFWIVSFKLLSMPLYGWYVQSRRESSRMEWWKKRDQSFVTGTSKVYSVAWKWRWRIELCENYSYHHCFVVNDKKKRENKFASECVK